MSVLFFSSVQDAAAQGFQGMVQAEVWPERPEIYRTVRALSRRLRRPRGSLRIAVIHVSSLKELKDVVLVKDLLDDLATILILPEADTDHVAGAHEMRPRFLASKDSNPILLGAVLAKMLKKTKEKRYRKE